MSSIRQKKDEDNDDDDGATRARKEERETTWRTSPGGAPTLHAFWMAVSQSQKGLG